MITAPPAGYANNDPPLIAVSEFTYPNTTSPPSVVNSPIIGIMSYAINALWPATRTPLRRRRASVPHVPQHHKALHYWSLPLCQVTPRVPLTSRNHSRTLSRSPRTWEGIESLLISSRSDGPPSNDTTSRSAATDRSSPRAELFFFQPPSSVPQTSLALPFPNQASLLRRSEPPWSGGSHEWTGKGNLHLRPQDHSSLLRATSPPQVSRPAQTGTTGLSVSPATLPWHLSVWQPRCRGRSSPPSSLLLQYSCRRWCTHSTVHLLPVETDSRLALPTTSVLLLTYLHAQIIRRIAICDKDYTFFTVIISMFFYT